MKEKLTNELVLCCKQMNDTYKTTFARHHFCSDAWTGGGLSSYASNPKAVVSGLETCLDQAKSSIPSGQRGSTPVYLGATAGMRLLRFVLVSCLPFPTHPFLACLLSFFWLSSHPHLLHCENNIGDGGVDSIEYREERIRKEEGGRSE